MLFGTLPVYDTPAPQPAQDVPETDFGNMPTGCACRWDANDNRVATCVRHQGWLDVVREWADRAKAAEAALKSAQPAQGERDDSYPFYELKYIMRVLGSAGDAPKQDWQTAHGMARGIFTRWHKDALQSAQPVAQQAQTLGEIVNKWQATPGALVHPDLAKAVSELQPVRASTNTT